jgi:hypothetical protein
MFITKNEKKQPKNYTANFIYFYSNNNQVC